MPTTLYERYAFHAGGVASMAHNNKTEYIALLGRTLAKSLDFSGRSRRTEVVYYWIATALLSTVFAFIISTLLPLVAALVINQILKLTFALPFFALLVRRLHDQDRPGWWALMLPAILSLDILATIRFILVIYGAGSEADTDPSPIELWIGLPLVFTALVLTFLPGTIGLNRFGPDPRLE
ncbi:hypothetical protein ASD39_18820 [Sphingomonas sp. Root50]|nr:hypothetical protein ASD17_16155 [Sphingomonas sp. Root1294]KQY72017.1 hypothetical protein ASD39_18820 [Sphingomonas sp. Root50]